MLIIGCDYHPGFQQIAYVDMETGELQERRLKHPISVNKATACCVSCWWKRRRRDDGWVTMEVFVT